MAPNGKQSASEAAQSARTSDGDGLRRIRPAAFVVILVAVAVIAWLLIRNNDNGSSSSTPAKIVTQSGLSDLQSSVGHPVYWLGPRPNTKLELKENDQGYIYLRYIAPSASAGARTPYLTVGTYAIANAYGRLLSAANQPGAIRKKTQDGALVVTNKSNPTNVYLAYPNSGIQIEVFDPNPKTALKLATSGVKQVP